MPRKDRNDGAVYRKLLSLPYSGQWDCYTDNDHVCKVLSHASKRNTNNPGFPDYIYVNEAKRLLVLVEVKPSAKLHSSAKGDNPEKYAVDGILFYLSRFLPDNLSEDLRSFFESWHIVGVAVSGDLSDSYSHVISTFVIAPEGIRCEESVTEILDEHGYLNIFDDRNENELIERISASSKKINRWLRSVDSQKRPVLLSALMICLYPTENEPNDFIFTYRSFSAQTIVDNIIPTVKRVLENEKIPLNKIDVIINELAFISTDRDLNDNEKNLLRDILDELNDVVIPLFAKKTNFDIVGKFYEEFLRFAGVSNVKKGIVLTPRHITELFTELVDLKYNDVILDLACGTGSFLISAMNRLVEIIDASSLPDKTERKNNVKNRQLIGFEKNATMFTCALSNMMFHGDGKSNLYFCDCFSSEADSTLGKLLSEGIQPTVGFINPPYGGRDNHNNPTKKELQFLAKMLDVVSRYGVMIAPLSVFFSDDELRNEILKRHTLKYVVNMPKDLFMPNAATATAIAVFETNKPQGNQKVIFTELSDDGFVLSSKRGRVDSLRKWPAVQSQLLDSLHNPGSFEDGLHLVCRPIEENDEWILQAYAQIDYSQLSTAHFEKSVKKRLFYVAKRDLGLLNTDLDEISLLEAVSDYYDRPFTKHPSSSIDTKDWRCFRFDEIFDRHNGRRLTKQDMNPGTTNFIGAIQGNNGVRDHISEKPLFSGNVITVNYNGSVGEAFFQSEPYWPSDDVYTLGLKEAFDETLDVQLAMFLITLISLHKQNYDYGRKWSSHKMERSLIKLPITSEGKPDWRYMRKLIASLPYSDLLQ